MLANRDVFAYPIGTDAEAQRARTTFTADNEEQPSWAPDGLSFAYKRQDDVWVARWDGSEVRRVTNAPDGTNNTQPSWSADGRTPHGGGADGARGRGAAGSGRRAAARRRGLSLQRGR